MLCSIRFALALSIAVSAAHVDPGFRADVEAWRQKHDQWLRGERGWLAVSGLYWLQPGRNVLPAPYDQAGWFELDGDKVIAHVDGGAKELKEDDDATDVEFRRYVFELHSSGRRLAIRVWDEDNPRRKNYPAVRWFPIDPAYRIEAKFVPYDKPKEIVVQNLAGDSEKTTIPGRAEFKLNGKEFKLIGWVYGSRLMFVFRDRTSGKTTYPTARFLVTEMPKNGVVILDFNKAYNPPCAFTNFATCPLPPAGNQMTVSVAAGEMMPPEHH